MCFSEENHLLFERKQQRFSSLKGELHQICTLTTFSTRLGKRTRTTSKRRSHCAPHFTCAPSASMPYPAIQLRQNQAGRVAQPKERSCSVSCVQLALAAAARAATLSRRFATGRAAGSESGSQCGAGSSPRRSR